MRLNIKATELVITLEANRTWLTTVNPDVYASNQINKYPGLMQRLFQYSSTPFDISKEDGDILQRVMTEKHQLSAIVESSLNFLNNLIDYCEFVKSIDSNATVELSEKEVNQIKSFSEKKIIGIDI